jgi:D-alanyl-D-alanine carboxypeptidase
MIGSQRKKRFIANVLIAAGLIFGVYLLWSNVDGKDAVNKSKLLEAAVTALDTEIFSEPFKRLHIGEIADTRMLELVNYEYGISGEPVGNLVPVSDYVWTLDTHVVMNRDALIMLKALFDTAAGIGYTEFRVTEGYRTHDYQQSIYDGAADKSFAAIPGHSEHQLGLAADISYHGVNIGNSQQGTWLRENAYKFRFILRYPQGKEHLTGVPYEPWHFRYRGQPHAYFCMINNLCFEEYILFLKENGGYAIELNGVEYTVLYQIPENDMIIIPHSLYVSISGDNTGGYIITAWD